jgi:hypothetical protein
MLVTNHQDTDGGTSAHSGSSPLREEGRGTGRGVEQPDLVRRRAHPVVAGDGSGRGGGHFQGSALEENVINDLRGRTGPG